MGCFLDLSSAVAMVYTPLTPYGQIGTKRFFASKWKLVILLPILIFGFYSLLHQRSWRSSEMFRNPFHFTDLELKFLGDIGEKIKSREPPTSAKNDILVKLSDVVQVQLTRLQQVNVDCNGPTLLCGHFDSQCGFACQIHHRMTCLAISYFMGIPLIHDAETGWAFEKPWSSAFERLGSSCSIGSETMKLTWTDRGPKITKDSALCSFCSLPNPLEDGFTVPKEVQDLVQQLHTSPFLWWAGQFAKYTLRLSIHQQHLLNEAKSSIGLNNGSHPTFGIHVRRTDKVHEDQTSFHNLSTYFEDIDQIQDVILNTAKTISPKNISIFVASESHSILQEACEMFPNRRILGFVSNATLLPNEREGFLDDVIRDVLILAESEYIVCGFSSNVCRLLLEILSSRYADVNDRVKSLDGKYEYIVWGWGFTVPLTVITK